MSCCCNLFGEGATPLHVTVEQPRMEVMGMNILPLSATLVGMMSDAKRINKMAKQAAPKSLKPADWFDWFQENPYEITERLPGKIWSVKYHVENSGAFSSEAELQLMGMNFCNRRTADKVRKAAKLTGNKQLMDQVEKDLARCMELMALVKEKGKTAETVRAVGSFANNMIVVKLNDGSVLLYSPVQVRDEFEFAKWLESIGPVKWIVSGSSSHTLQIPNILKRFPEAKYVVAGDAWLKIKLTPGGISKDSPDYDYTQADQLQDLNKMLRGQGVECHYITGDEATNALILVAHRTALEVDVIYSTCGMGVFDVTDEQFWKLEEKDMDNRLFKLGLCSSPTSPNNALPPYRFWLLDPLGPLTTLSMSTVKRDGSSCKEMAAALREVLRQDFDQALGVHFDAMTGDDFRKSVDMNWSWLDGSSLLPNII